DNLEDLPSNPVWYVQPKLDGIRCLIVDGKLLSNTLKPIPNQHLWESMKSIREYNKTGLFEGELIIPHKTHQDTMSVVMSEDKDASEVKFWCFDRILGPECFNV